MRHLRSFAQKDKVLCPKTRVEVHRQCLDEDFHPRHCCELSSITSQPRRLSMGEALLNLRWPGLTESLSLEGSSPVPPPPVRFL